ncbi:MAG: dihydrodipicolinate synthase family protein [Promethearchaeota archaeon]|jgi:N-acetylneuraminate lyase/4-hydroxy-tetrahydrodipicolinate synthase
MFKPEGVCVAMILPYNEDGSINKEELKKLVEFQIDKGVHGFLPLGSIGEFIHLSREEKIKVIEIVVETVNGRAYVIPNVSSSHPKQSIELALEAKKLGCSGVLVSPPYYYNLSNDMIEKHFEEIIDAIDIPVILYNIPGFTQSLSYGIVKGLSQRKNVVGMKDSSGSMVDFLHFMDEVRSIGGNMNFMPGREETFFASLMMGATGSITGIAAVLPEFMVGIYNHWKKGSFDHARQLQNSILEVIRVMNSFPFPMGSKLALEARGFKMGPPRQPLSDLQQSRLSKVQARIEKTMKPLLERIEKGELLQD